MNFFKALDQDSGGSFLSGLSVSDEFGNRFDVAVDRDSEVPFDATLVYHDDHTNTSIQVSTRFDVWEVKIINHDNETSECISISADHARVLFKNVLRFGTKVLT